MGSAVVLEGGWHMVVSTPGPQAFGDGREQAPRCLGETRGKDFFPNGKWREEGGPQGDVESRDLKKKTSD